MEKDEFDGDAAHGTAIRLHHQLQVLDSLMSHLAPTLSYLSTFAPDGVSLWHEYDGKGLRETFQLRFEQSLTGLGAALESVRAKIRETSSERGFSEHEIRQIEEFQRLVGTQVQGVNEERKRMPYLREKLNALLPVVLDRGLAKSIKRDFSRAASLFLRTSCLEDLLNVEWEVRELLNETSSLCEYYALLMEKEEPFELVPVVNVIGNAVRCQSGFASEERIELRPEWRMARGEKFCVQIDGMTRALSNIIHNAIKYSYKMENDHAWVAITCDRRAESIVFSIEDWGLAVPVDEIQSGELFAVGRRGALSRRRGASGNGLGLAYAKAVVDKHGGTIGIESKPAKTGCSSTDYSRPFITTVTVSIPVQR